MDFHFGGCATMITGYFWYSRGLSGRALHRCCRRRIVLDGTSHSSARVLAYTRGERVSLRIDTKHSYNEVIEHPFQRSHAAI